MNEITVNNVTLSIDLDDLDRAAQVQQAIKDSQQKINTVKDTDDYVTGGRKVCEVINECFDSAFGAGTAEQIFEGMRFTEHIDAFAVLGNAIREQLEERCDHVKTVFQKYSPSRTERRHPAAK